MIITGAGEYKTRNGRKAVVLGSIPENKVIPWAGYIGASHYCWDAKGMTSGSRCSPKPKRPTDIIAPYTEPKTYEWWVNVYRYSVWGGYHNEIHAKNSASSDVLATRHLRYTEGGKIEDVTEEGL